MGRRRFVRVAAGATAALAAGGLPALASCGDPMGPDKEGRSPLRRPADLPAGTGLTAAPGTATIAEGESSAAWLFNGNLPGPTLRLRRGDQVRVRLTDGPP